MAKNTFALIIGVNDYTLFDSTGKSNLKGAVNDARRWHDFLVNTAGLAVPSPNIHLLTAPEGSTTSRDTAPTLSHIKDGITWLIERMTVKEGDKVKVKENASGLIVLCGHGVRTEGGDKDWFNVSAAFCPMNVKPDGKQIINTLHFDEIEYFLQKEGIAQNVTVVFDACFANAPAPRIGARGLLGVAAAYDRPGLEGSDIPSKIRSRLLLACEPDTHAYEFLSHGGWHGAFSTALLDLLERWKVQKDGDLSWVRVSYGNLIHRSRTLLDSLGVPQSSMLVAYPQVSLVPFLRAGVEHGDHLSSAEPDADLIGGQLSPGTDWFRVLTLETGSFKDAAPSILGICLVLGKEKFEVASDKYYYPGVEYWFLKDISNITLSDYRLTVTDINDNILKPNLKTTIDNINKTINNNNAPITVVSCGHFRDPSNSFPFKTKDDSFSNKIGIYATKSNTTIATLEFAISKISSYTNPQLFSTLKQDNNIVFNTPMTEPIRTWGTNFAATTHTISAQNNNNDQKDGAFSNGNTLVYTACISIDNICSPVSIAPVTANGNSVQITVVIPSNLPNSAFIQIYRTVIEKHILADKVIGNEMIKELPNSTPPFSSTPPTLSITFTDSKTTTFMPPDL